MSNKVYDKLAWLNRVFLPALTALATAILTICKVDANVIGAVGGIMAAIITFLGAILQDRKAIYEGLKKDE